MSTHIEAKKGDIAETILLPGDPQRAKWIAETFFENPICFNTVRGMLGYTGMFKGKRISVTEKVMDSCSMYGNITQSMTLSKNDVLQIHDKTSNLKKTYASIKMPDSHFTTPEIDVFKGPEFDLLSKQQQDELISKIFTISKENNRMAYQLNDLLPNDLKPIITSAVLPGTVQLTPAGNLIILMRDCQTTGGYPRVLQLKDASINVLAQKFTGYTINFRLV